MIITVPRLCAWVVIWTTFFFGVLRVSASNEGSSCAAVKPATDSASVPLSESTPAPLGAKFRKTHKYDFNRIGQRNVGKGANLYSLEKERSLGAKMAATVDLQTISASDEKIKDYLNRLGQKIVRSSDA